MSLSTYLESSDSKNLSTYVIKAKKYPHPRKIQVHALRVCLQQRRNCLGILCCTCAISTTASSGCARCFQLNPLEDYEKMYAVAYLKEKEREQNFLHADLLVFQELQLEITKYKKIAANFSQRI